MARLQFTAKFKEERVPSLILTDPWTLKIMSRIAWFRGPTKFSSAEMWLF